MTDVNTILEDYTKLSDFIAVKEATEQDISFLSDAIASINDALYEEHIGLSTKVDNIRTDLNTVSSLATTNRTNISSLYNSIYVDNDCIAEKMSNISSKLDATYDTANSNKSGITEISNALYNDRGCFEERMS